MAEVNRKRDPSSPVRPPLATTLPLLPTCRASSPAPKFLRSRSSARPINPGSRPIGHTQRSLRFSTVEAAEAFLVAGAGAGACPLAAAAAAAGPLVAGAGFLAAGAVRPAREPAALSWTSESGPGEGEAS